MEEIDKIAKLETEVATLKDLVRALVVVRQGIELNGDIIDLYNDMERWLTYRADRFRKDIIRDKKRAEITNHIEELRRQLEDL